MCTRWRPASAARVAMRSTAAGSWVGKAPYPTAPLTGERPVAGSTPDSLLALHDAGYREVLARLGPGRFLDVGCGLGDGTARFAVGGQREVVAIDYDQPTALRARTAHGFETAC